MQSDLAPKRQARGVYVEQRTVNGYRVYYSVRADGEEGALRTVPPGVDPTAAIAWLWEDLDRHDPVTRVSFYHGPKLLSLLWGLLLTGHYLGPLPA